MRSARPKFFFLSFLIGGILWAASVFAAEGEPLKSDLGGIKARLAALEEGQKEILAKEDKILKELEILKIWVHRK